MLRTAVLSASKRQARMPHLLIHATAPGVGKSTLLQAAAAHLPGRIVELPPPITRKTFAQVLHRAAGGMIVIDEIGGLTGRMEWLLMYMTEGMLPTRLGGMPVPVATIAGATTDLDRVSGPLRSRFEMVVQLDPYTKEEATEIARRMLDAEGVPSPAHTCVGVAQAAAHNPREIKRVARLLRDIFVAEGRVDLPRALRWAGLNADGTRPEDMRYLKLLADAPDFTLSLSVLKAVLDVPPAVSEPRLMAAGLVSVTSQGRGLTREGYEKVMGE
jgi:holliday junction DNA helicase RuvB